MDYTTVKYIHIALAIASILFFLVRAGASINRSRSPSMGFRVLTHLIDTALLGFGATLAFMLSISPFTSPWFAWKLAAILAYVVCGVVVMKGKSKRVKEIGMVLSLALIAYIFILAINKDPYNLTIF